ncbi:unnamed protein product [Cylicocyclus nassatus]|uniref:Uncharacterized protein n=1 Tax=Cylicocyclus nassatus TaxID=53992 RepID=A0AA36DQT5_CYLNA|nr:unnamed protein product [Cylicocyclus nassatus]
MSLDNVPEEKVPSAGLVAVVTGANSGVGYEIAKGLNMAKVKVYMLCRDEGRASTAKASLVEAGCDADRLTILQCDLSNFNSIRTCVKELLMMEDKIDILINNASVMFLPNYERTVDGHELTWQCNYLGPFLLTHLLLPGLAKAHAARIIFVASVMHRLSDPLNLATIDGEQSFGRIDPYNRSKLAIIMLARELSKRLQEKGIPQITVNSLHPGVVNSNAYRNTILFSTPLRQISYPFRWLFFKSPWSGARTPLYLALSKQVEGISGGYFADCKVSRVSRYALDDNACKELYEYSMQQCGILE